MLRFTAWTRASVRVEPRIALVLSGVVRISKALRLKTRWRQGRVINTGQHKDDDRKRGVFNAGCRASQALACSPCARSEPQDLNSDFPHNRRELGAPGGAVASTNHVCERKTGIRSRNWRGLDIMMTVRQR